MCTSAKLDLGVVVTCEMYLWNCGDRLIHESNINTSLSRMVGVDMYNRQNTEKK